MLVTLMSIAITQAQPAPKLDPCAHDRAALLVEAQGDRGDPMTWPRLSLQVAAHVIDDPAGLRNRWLDAHPKAAVFIDLPDFRFYRLVPLSGFLNAGFGAAFRLTPADLRLR